MAKGVVTDVKYVGDPKLVGEAKSSAGSWGREQAGETAGGRSGGIPAAKSAKTSRTTASKIHADKPKAPPKKKK